MLTARDGQPGENPLQGHTHIFLEKLMSDSEEYIHLAEKEAMAPVWYHSSTLDYRSTFLLLQWEMLSYEAYAWYAWLESLAWWL